VLLSVGDGFDGFCWVIVLVETTQADGFFHMVSGVSGYDLAGDSTEGSIVTIAALFPILYTKAIRFYYILFGPPYTRVTSILGAVVHLSPVPDLARHS
jgi:hypothetical protein